RIWGLASRRSAGVGWHGWDRWRASTLLPCGIGPERIWDQALERAQSDGALLHGGSEPRAKIRSHPECARIWDRVRRPSPMPPVRRQRRLVPGQRLPALRTRAATAVRIAQPPTG